MNKPAVFNFQTHSIRVVDVEGSPWFVCSDVAEALGYRDSANAARHLDDDEKGTRNVSTLGGTQKLTVISESGLYALVLRSRKPEARRFAKWVTSEVLPAIRKKGSYSTGTQEMLQFDAFEEYLKSGRFILTMDKKGHMHLQPIAKDASVLRDCELASYIADPFYVSKTMLPAIIESAAKRLNTTISAAI